MVLLIDNYDSFTWNLYAQLRAQGCRVEVVRHDDTRLPEWSEIPAGLVISPGPGRPVDAGYSEQMVRRYWGKIPILGVCLGHQLIGEMCGARVVHAPVPVHGKVAQVQHTGTGLFAGLPQPMDVMRYHSLVLSAEAFPEELEITAQTPDGLIMGIQHKMYNLAGVQFHPESVLTPAGDALIRNWLIQTGIL